MPAWLRRLQPYLLLSLLALPALWPLTHPGLPRTNDNINHLYRLVEFDRLIRAGVLLPRWAPDLVLGYGYPIFNFQPYLAHYLAEILHLLGPGFPAAFKGTYALALLCAGWFAFQLGREHFDEPAGLLVGTAYLYSPFLLYDVHVRGALLEAVALAILPLAFLWLRRAAQGNRRAVAWAGLAIGALIFAHNAVSLQTLPFLGLYGLWQFWANGRGRGSVGLGVREVLFVTLPFVIGLLLSAFYWLPALAETHWVQFENALNNGGMLYFENFQSLPELLAWPRLPADPDLLNPPVVRSLPQAALLLAALALLRGRKLHPYRFTLAFFALAALAGTLLITPLARPLWEALPLLRQSLFPWRLLGPVSLFIALLAGAFLVERIYTATGGRWRAVLPAAAFGLIVINGLPFASPPFESVPERPTLADVARWESPPLLLGTTNAAEFLPGWVKQLPDLTVHRAQLLAGQPVTRYDAADGRVTLLTSRALGDTFRVIAPEPFTFVYQMFYFPGWRTTVNGRPAPVRPTDPEGLMAVDLPAGSNVVTFTFGSTSPRVTGDMLSLGGLVTIVGLLLQAGRRQKTAGSLPSAGSLLPAAFYPAAFVLAAALAIARPLLYDAGYMPLLRRGLTPDGLRGVQHPLNIDFAGELTLLGWEADRESIAGDQSLTVDFYWKANHRIGIPFGFNVRLTDTAGRKWSENETPHPRDWRFMPGTDFWPVDQYLVDSYVLTPLAGTPPGEYQVEVTAFSGLTLEAIGVVPAGTIRVASPTRERRCAGTDLAPLGPALSLQAATVNRSEAAPGDEVLINLCWLAQQNPGADLPGQLQLLDGTSRVAVSHAFALGGLYPSARWQAGDLVRDQVTVPLPATLETGDYRWALAVGGSSVALDSLHVTAPVRTFTPPVVERRLDAHLGPVTLLGVTLPAPGAKPGTAASLTLVWTANQTPASGLRVFVHLTDSAGTLLAQSDRVPADWTRPTPGWLPGEFVSDTHTLNLPADLAPGDYALFAGMYDATTGGRLTTPLFADGRVPLGALLVAP